MAAVVWLSMRFGMLVSIGFALAMYAATAWWLEVFSPRELAMLLRAVRGRAAPEHVSSANAGIHKP